MVCEQKAFSGNMPSLCWLNLIQVGFLNILKHDYKIMCKHPVLCLRTAPTQNFTLLPFASHTRKCYRPTVTCACEPGMSVYVTKVKVKPHAVFKACTCMYM